MKQQPQSFNHFILSAMDDYADQICFKIKQHGHYQPISYSWFQEMSFRLVKFFQNQGLAAGDRVALVADNSLEWILTYMAALLAGGAVVPLRTSLPVETLRFILNDCQARFIVLQTREHIEAITASLQADAISPLPHIQTVLVTPNDQTNPDLLSIEAILYQNTALTAQEQTDFRAIATAVETTALFSINYVTSETGQHKGAVFDHGRILATMGHLADWLIFEEDDLVFTSRPWSEAANLWLTVYCFISGMTNALSDTPETAVDSMRQLTPTIMLTIPYGLERFYEACMAQIGEQQEANQKMFQWALAKGKAYRDAGETASPELRQEYLRADMTFFSQFRGQVGGRLRRLYVTGAALSKEVAEFFEAIGSPALNIYSLTEAGGFPAVIDNPTYRLGSCGQVAPGFEIRIAEDGELLVRGEMVMREYWQRPFETQEAFDEKGWLYTGDEGRLDEEGYLYITGRKQHLMVLSTGRKFAPTMIENILTESPFISQAAIFGEAKPYVSAMVVPDLSALEAHFQDIKDEEGEAITTTAHPKVKALLNEIINQVNSHLDIWEQIREYSLLEQPLSQATGELTPSMRISRNVVAERYAAQIEAMYPEMLQLGAQALSQVQIDPERLRDLLEKEIILDAWMTDAGIEFLFDVARELQIDAPSMVNICDVAASIAQMESEEKPLSTALIVGDPVQIARILPPSQVQLLYHDHIRRMRKVLITLTKMVDGLVLGYVVDKYGYVRGIHKLEVSLEQRGEALLGPQFRHHAAISYHCQAIVFFVPTGGRQVLVFADGKLIGRYAHGDWSREKISHIDEIITQLADQRNYDQQLLNRLLRCAFQMSEQNLGAIFLVGDSEVILQNSDNSETSSFANIVSVAMESLSDRALINFAKQDGATVIDQQGQFRGCMVLLRPAADTQANIGSGKGARHSSAAKMSAEANCLAITVSQDGPITIYESGRRVLSL